MSDDLKSRAARAMDALAAGENAADPDPESFGPDGFTEFERINLQYALIHLPPQGQAACNKLWTNMAQQRLSATRRLEQAEKRGAEQPALHRDARSAKEALRLAICRLQCHAAKNVEPNEQVVLASDLRVLFDATREPVCLTAGDPPSRETTNHLRELRARSEQG